MPVSVTLFLHAVEMLLKGFLARSATLEELREAGHNILNLWQLFRARNLSPSLAQFESVIARLDRVERLRYPDSILEEGFALRVSLSPIAGSLQLPGTEDLPQYDAVVSDLDAIVSLVYDACGVSPTSYLSSAPEAFRQTLPVGFRPENP